MSERKSEIIKLYPGRFGTFLYLLVSLAFTVSGIPMIKAGDSMGWLCVIFFGTGCIVFTVNMLPNSSYLMLSEEGFEVRNLFRSDFTRWEEVSSFGTGRIESNDVVTIKYSQAHTKYDVAKTIAVSLAGIEGMLPDTYGKSAEELAQLMNGWKIRHSRT